MRDRDEIEADANAAQKNPGAKPSVTDLTLEVLLDIRDQLRKIHVELSVSDTGQSDGFSQYPR